MLMIVFGAGCLLLSVLFHAASLLHLGLPLLYALIVPTLFSGWYYSRYGASGDTAFFKKHSNINGFRTPEQRNYLYSALLKQSISAAIARFISR